LFPFAMKLYIVLMILAVVAGTLFDISHKGSGTYFAQRREKSKASAQRRLSGSETMLLALGTIAEAAVSGEFCKWPRRASHLLMMYGFLLYVVTTAVMVFAYPAAETTPGILPALWATGALMILVGSLLASAGFALIWHFVQTAYVESSASRILFALYIFFTTLLFVSVPWSKFAHMFFKPAAAFQKRIEEANGSTDLPSPAAENYIGRS
jgi:ABC-type transport system involved in cytochrome bd biosynthesis fused ATPase/permease subunit